MDTCIMFKIGGFIAIFNIIAYWLPISSTLKENAQPGFELALTGLPIFPVQHL